MARWKFQGTTKDQSGRILPSATVSVYLAGTTTAASVYTSVTSTTAVNSVTSSSTDATYSFYTDSFDYDHDQAFKIIITKTNYTSVTYDNLPHGEVVLGTYTISTAKTITTYVKVSKGVVYAKSGSGSLTFNGPFEAGLYQVFSGFSTGDITFGTGSIDYFRPEWAGASPSASAATNTTAFQFAFDVATKQGFPLKIGSGVYLLNNLLLNYKGAGYSAAVTIEGAGDPGDPTSELTTTFLGGTILKFEKTDGTHFITPTINLLGIVVIKNLMIQGSDTDGTSTSGDGIHFDVSGSGAALRLENVSIHHFRGGNGVYLNLAISSEFRNVNLNHNLVGLYAITINASSFHNLVTQFNTSYAIKVYGTMVVGFYGLLIQANNLYGVYINGCSNIAFYNGYWEANNQADNINIYDVLIEGTSGAPVYEPSFHSCRFIVKGGAVNPPGIYIGGVVDGKVLNPLFVSCRTADILPIFGNYILGYYSINSPGFDSYVGEGSGVMYGFSVKERGFIQALSFATPWVPDLGLSGFYQMTLTNNLVVSGAIGCVGGDRLTIILKQDATGSRTVTWDSGYKNVPAINSAANSWTLYQFMLEVGTTVFVHVAS